MENLVAEADMKNLVAMADRARAKPKHPDKSKKRAREIVQEIKRLTLELKANRLSRAGKLPPGIAIIKIPYTVIETRVGVKGEDIRTARYKAGVLIQSDFADDCGWSPSLQSQYEAPGQHDLALSAVEKMTRVCNARSIEKLYDYGIEGDAESDI